MDDWLTLVGIVAFVVAAISLLIQFITLCDRVKNIEELTQWIADNLYEDDGGPGETDEGEQTVVPLKIVARGR